MLLSEVHSILVTGGCGFIGTNFIQHLLQHYEHLLVHNVDKLDYNSNPTAIAAHPRYTLHHADVQDRHESMPQMCDAEK